MNLSSPLQRATPWLWVTLAAIVITLTACARLPIRPELIIPVVILAFICLFVIFVVSILLTFRYRALIRHWYVWGALVISCIISGSIMQYGSNSQISGMQLFGTLLFISTTSALLTVILIKLKRHDIGFPVISVVSLASIWGLVVAWRMSDDLLGEILGSIFLPSTELPRIFWLNYFWALSFCCIVPLALISVVFHTCLYIKRELQPEDPHKEH
jgi:hypothetical protein